MKLDIMMQTGELNLAKCLENEMELKPKKMYIFSGSIKETGFDIIEENIVDSNVKLTVYMGVDKKNTTKSLLQDILEYADEVYYYNNNEIKEFDGSFIVLENDKRAVIYFVPGKLSENSMKEDLVIISKVTYDLNLPDDKKEYKQKIKDLTSVKELGFDKLTKTKISQLIEDKIIFSNKQYEHSVKSIAELLGKNEEKQEKTKVETSNEDIDAAKFEIPTVDLNSNISDFDIDVSMVEDAIIDSNDDIGKEAKKKSKNEEILQNEYTEDFEDESEDDETEAIDENEVIDLDSMLFTKAKVKLKDKKESKSEKKEKEITEFDEDEVLKVKKLDLNNVTNFIMQLPAKMQNKKDLDLIKIPNYIRDLIPGFFEFPDKSCVVDDSGIQSRQRVIETEIVDCKNNQKYLDKESMIFQRKGQTFTSIKCKDLENINYEENDIVRIIKLSTDIYHIEIVTKDMQEYKIWEKIMNQKFRAGNRKYGIM